MPIYLQDGKDGLWVEIFITSSINLIVPITCVLIPRYTKTKCNDDLVEFKELWRESLIDKLPWTIRRWILIYNNIFLIRREKEQTKF